MSNGGRGGNVKTFFVKISGLRDAERFVHACTKISGDVNVGCGRREADGKSLLGVLSLNLEAPVAVDIVSKDDVDISEFQEFLVNT